MGQGEIDRDQASLLFGVLNINLYSMLFMPNLAYPSSGCYELIKSPLTDINEIAEIKQKLQKL